MTLQDLFLRNALEWSYRHPRVRIRLREGWGLLREVGERAHLPVPFEPPLFRDLRRIADGASSEPPSARRMLFLSMRGWSTHLAIETTLAHAVRQRGIEPVFVSCGGRLPVCDVAPVHAAPPMPCHSCSSYARGAIAAAGFAPRTLTSFIDVGATSAGAQSLVSTLATINDCEAFEHEGLPLGRLVRTSVLWFLSRGTLCDDVQSVTAYQRFLIGGIVLQRAFTAALDRVQPERIFLLNGAFFAERILCQLATERGVDVVRYEKGFITDTVLMSRWRSGVDDLDPGDVAWQEASGRALSDSEAREIDEYLETRARGGRTLDNFWQHRNEDLEAIRDELRLPAGRPLVVLFCNILWDSAIQDKDVAFPSMSGWLTEAVRWAARHRDVDLVVRIHPAEVRLANHVSRERMADHLADTFVTMPANVRVVPAESLISSYALMRAAVVGLVYTSTMGLEMAAQGIPVVTAGVTHYGRRGFTNDPADPDAYWATVERLVHTSPSVGEIDHTRELARRYAHLFFFRFHQSLHAVHEVGRSQPRVVARDAGALAPGRDPDLDRIVDGILGATGPVVTPPAEA
jgi:hypothetical protein